MKYPTLEELKAYRDSPYISQSFLKSILANNIKPIKETVPMIIGTYLDGLLSLPHEADNLFQVGLSKRPSDNIKTFIDNVLCILLEEWSEESSPILDISDYRKELIEEAGKINYQPKWGEDAVWNSIKKDGEEYWNECISSRGKKIITKEEHLLCTQVCSLTLNSAITGGYFAEHKNVDKYFQLPLYWMVEDVLCKGLADLVIVEHDIKIIHLIDIKSTSISNIQDWFTVARQKNYPLQLSFYKKGIEVTFKDLIDEDYEIDCKWIVIPTNTTKFTPWVIPCTDAMLTVGEYGYSKLNYYKINEHISTGHKKHHGWREAISRYKRSKEQGLVDYDIHHYLCNGRMEEKEADETFFL